MHAKYRHQHEERRHHHLGDALNTLLHAQRANAETKERDQKHPARHLQRVADHGVEHGGDVHALGAEGARSHLEKIGYHPAAHTGVEGHEQIITHDGKPLEAMPLAPARLKRIEAARRGAVARASHGKLHHQQGQTQDHQEQDNEQHECGAAVLARDVGETPDVAQADGAAGADEQKTQTAREALAALAVDGGIGFRIVLAGHSPAFPLIIVVTRF